MGLKKNKKSSDSYLAPNNSSCHRCSELCLPAGGMCGYPDMWINGLKPLILQACGVNMLHELSVHHQRITVAVKGFQWMPKLITSYEHRATQSSHFQYLLPFCHIKFNTRSTTLNNLIHFVPSFLPKTHNTSDDLHLHIDALYSSA